MSVPEGPGTTQGSTSATTSSVVGGRSVAMTIDDVVKQGNNVSDSAAHAAAAQVDLGAARGGGADFTSFPSARAVFAQHQGVVGVFEQTLGLIHDDVQEFGSSIVQAARTYQQTDDDALACLQTVAAGVSPTTLDRADQQVRQTADQLEDVTLTAQDQHDLAARDAAAAPVDLVPGGPDGSQ